MKKIILLCAFALATTLSAFALDGYAVQTFQQKTDDKNVVINLEYTEETNNLIVKYTVKYRSFDEGDAFVAIRDTVKRFADEHGYKSYKTYSDDVIKYHDTVTELTRFIILYK